MHIEEIAKQVGLIHERGRAETVFGEPKTIGARTVIPVAKVSVKFGFGLGQGKQAGSAAKEEGQQEGVGGGGGGVMSVEPVALIEMKDDRIALHPVVDWGKVIKIAGLVAGIGLVLLALSSLQRRKGDAEA